MTIDNKKLKLNIKGNFRRFWNRLFLKKRIESLGVLVHDIKDHSTGHTEILVEGKKENLWGVVSWSKKGNLFFVLNEVAFEFIE